MSTAESPLLEIRNLVTSFKVEGVSFRAVNDISFTLHRNKTLGIVGESGCGKSVTSLSVLRLIPEPPGSIDQGEILFDGKDLLKLSESALQRVRGNQISMIFQEPMTALNPVFTVGNQVSEVFTHHRGMKPREAREKAIELLKSVGIPSPEQRVDEYPHQLSGGMRQRVMIAMALACRPKLLIADEPTTALDVTIQAQILELMNALQKEVGMSILLITHDLGVVADVCDDVVVMYAGRIVEKASVRQVFKSPKHPYTQGLLKSKITLDQKATDVLTTIPGTVPSLARLPRGCSFQERCPHVMPRCREQVPPLIDKGQAQWVACWLGEP